jgi:hypothetical protein
MGNGGSRFAHNADGMSAFPGEAGFALCALNADRMSALPGETEVRAARSMRTGRPRSRGSGVRAARTTYLQGGVRPAIFAIFFRPFRAICFDGVASSFDVARGFEFQAFSFERKLTTCATAASF